MIWRNIVSMRVNFRNFHSVCAIHCHANFFPSNQSVANFFSKTLIWRIFCEKTVAVRFSNFHKNSVKLIRFARFLHCWLSSRNILHINLTLWKFPNQTKGNLVYNKTSAKSTSLLKMFHIFWFHEIFPRVTFTLCESEFL